MNNMLNEFNTIFDTKLTEGIKHIQTYFEVAFLGRDDFKLKVNFWSKKIKINETYSENKCFFDATAKSYSGDRIGNISFDIDILNNKVFLDLIEVMPAFRSRGIGRSLLQFMEYISSRYNISNIDGIYARDLCNYSEQFYNSCGYNIYVHNNIEKVTKELNLETKYPFIKITNVKPITKKSMPLGESIERELNSLEIL